MVENSLLVELPIQERVSYPIQFGNNMFSRIARDLRDHYFAPKYCIITDSNVNSLHAKSLEAAIRADGLNVGTLVFEAGEKNKTIDTCIKIIGDMSELGYGRDSAIIALGGGVVGDLAGFVAAIFNRGVPYIQIPTTVVAQADSSVGGKTGVDTKHAKNLVGAFKHPQAVYIDVATLKTLPEREYRSGLAETVKHGVIRDQEFFNYLEKNVPFILERSTESSLFLARRNCEIKSGVVKIDPNEKSLRKILNYGHTVGHAIEKLSVDSYERRTSRDYLRHGEAISIGMMVAGRIAVELGFFSQRELEGQEELLKVFGLPTA